MDAPSSGQNKVWGWKSVCQLCGMVKPYTTMNEGWCTHVHVRNDNLYTCFDCLRILGGIMEAHKIAVTKLEAQTYRFCQRCQARFEPHGSAETLKRPQDATRHYCPDCMNVIGRGKVEQGPV